MGRVLLIAQAEFQAAVRSKAFIIGIVLVPLLAGGAILVQVLIEKHADKEDRSFAVIDRSGFMYERIAALASERNEELASPEDGSKGGARYLPVRIDPSGKTAEALRLELSEKVRAGELFAFVEIPGGLLETEAPPEPIRYYSEQPTYRTLIDWLRDAINEEVRARRFAAAGIDEKLISRLRRPVPVEELKVGAPKEGEEAPAAEKVDPVKTFGVPVFLMFLLFMTLMMSAPQLLNSVLEEKLSRISEVLLGSVTPFQLMLGKLLGSMGVSLLLAALYIAGGFLVAARYGYGDAVPLSIFLWFLLFLALAVFFFGSIFIALGAACSDIKDAQGLVTPVMLVLMVPLFTWTAVLRAPSSPLAVWLSLFPPATPLLMLLRISIDPGPPLWQVLLSLLLTTASTLACVWAAGKVFRIGILLQGKTPSLRELARWVIS